MYVFQGGDVVWGNNGVYNLSPMHGLSFSLLERMQLQQTAAVVNPKP